MPFDPWPTTFYIGWVQAGGAWVSRVLHLLHLLLMHLPWSGDWSCTLCRALLASYGVSCFLLCHSLWLASFRDCALLDHGPSFPQPILCSLRGLVSIFLLYHSAIPVVMLLDSILLGLFGPVVYFPPSDSVYSLGLFLHYLRAPMSHFPLGNPWPICFPWASSALFKSCFPMGLY